MPVGSPSVQTRVSKKYQEKVGLISKSYKLKKELVERFAEACDKKGIAQSAQISKMMEEFIKEVEDSKG